MRLGLSFVSLASGILRLLPVYMKNLRVCRGGVAKRSRSGSLLRQMRSLPRDDQSCRTEGMRGRKAWKMWDPNGDGKRRKRTSAYPLWPQRQGNAHDEETVILLRMKRTSWFHAKRSHPFGDHRSALSSKGWLPEHEPGSHPRQDLCWEVSPMDSFCGYSNFSAAVSSRLMISMCCGQAASHWPHPMQSEALVPSRVAKP